MPMLLSCTAPIEKRRRYPSGWRAEQANREQIVRIARTLMSRNETEAAFTLLQSRYDEFKADPVYLTQLCTAALQLKKIDESVTWARRLVELANNPLDMENAVGLAAKIIVGSEAEASLKRELAMSKLPQEICLLAELHERASESTEAEAALAKIEATAPELALAQLISLFRLRRDYESAAQAAVRLVETPGGRRTANVQKVVELYQSSGNLDKALEWLPEWKKLSPGSTASWLTEARLLADVGKNSEAIDVLRRASQQFEGNEDVRSALARMYADEGKLADANRMYMQLYEEGKDTSSKLRWVQQLASTAEMQGKSDALLEQFEERKRSNRSSLVPLLALAEIHRVSNNYEGRRQSLLEAARVKPKDIDLLMEIARIEETEGDFDKALETLRRALELEDSNRIKQRISQVHFAAGNNEAGFNVLRDMAGDDIDALTAEQLAMAIIGTGDWEHAVDFLLPLLDKFPDDYRIGYLYAIALEEGGNERAALAAFAALLGSDQEPAVARSLTPQEQQVLQYRKSRNSYQQTLKEIGPPELEVVTMASQYSYQAYTHRQQRSRGYGVQPARVYMPVDVEMVKDLSIAHILTIGRLGDEELLRAAKEATNSSGVRLPAFLFEFDSRSGNGQALAALIEDYPDDDALLAMIVLNASGGGQMIEPSVLDSAITRFTEKYPQLAFGATLAKLRAAVDEDEVKENLAQALELAESVDKPNYFVINSVVAATGVNDGSQNLDEDASRKLTDLLLKWYGGLDENDPYRAQMFQSITMALAKQEDLTAFVAFLDKAINDYEANSNGPANSRVGVYAGGGRNQQLLAPLTFPPATLPGFPDPVLMFLGDRNNNYYAQQMQLEPERLEPVVEKAVSPVLRLLLMHLSDPAGEKTAGLIAELLESSEPNLDTFMLAAGHAATIDAAPGKAVSILKRAKYLPMKREVRQAIDSALVAWAVDLQGGEGSDDAIAEGRDAALRLRRATLNSQQRLELVGAMEQLGMTDEAARLEKKLAASPIGGVAGGISIASSGFSYSSGRYNPQSQQRVDKFISEGKRDQAVKILATDLKGFAQAGLAAQNSYSSSRNESRWAAKVAGYGLTTELLKMLEPGAAPSFQKRAHWAFANEVLGESDAAIGLYNELLESRPKEDGIRMRLFSLLLEKDPAGAMALIDAMPATSMPGILNHFSNLVRRNTLPIEQRLSMVKQLASSIAARDDGTSMPQWLPQLADTVANIQNGDGFSVTNLYRPDEPGYDYENYDEEIQKQIADMLRQRREAHDFLCNLMLASPEYCREGFRRLSGGLMRDGKPSEEVYALAQKAANDFVQPKGAGMVQNQGIFIQQQDYNTMAMWFPEQYVVRYAFTGGKPGLAEEMAALLETKEPRRFGKQAAQELREYAELFFCDEASFLAEAEGLIKKRSRLNPRLSQSLFVQVLDILEVRGIKVDIAPLLFKQLEAAKTQGANDHSIVLKVAQLKVKEGEESFVKFMDGYTEVYLGPVDKREELVRRNFERNSWSSGTVNGGMHVYLETVSNMSRDASLFYQVYDYAERVIAPLFGEDRMDELSNPYQHPLYKEGGFKNFEKQIDFLRSSPIVAGVGEVRFYRNFSIQVASHIARLQESERDRYVEFLQSLKTIGGDFIAAVVHSQSSSEGDVMTKWFETHHTDITQLREQERAQIRNYLSQNRGSRALDKQKLTAEAAAVFAALNEQTDNRLQKEIEELLAAKSVRDLTIEDHELDDKGREYIQALLPEDRDKAALVYWKIIDLMEKARNSGGGYSYYGGGRSFGGYLLENSVGQKPENLNFVFDILSASATADGKAPPTPEAPGQYSMESILRPLVDGIRQKGEMITDADVFSQSLPKLAEVIDRKYWRYAIRSYFNYLDAVAVTGNDDKRISAILPVIEKAAQAGDYQELARELLFVAKLRAATLSKEKPEAEALAGVTSHALELLGDKTIPSAVRLEIAAALTGNCGKILPLSVTSSAVAVVSEVADARKPVSGEQMDSLLKWLGDAEPAEERDPIIATAIESWKKLFFNVRSIQQSGGNTPPASQNIVNLAAKAGDIETINAILNKLQGQSTLDGSWFLSILRNAPPEQVNRLLLKGWMNLDWRTAGSAAVYDEEIAARLPVVLNVVENPEFKMFTEALVLSMPDKKDSEQSAKPKPDEDDNTPSPRDTRLIELAGRFKQMEFKNPMVRDAVLAFIGESDLAAELLAEQYEAAAEMINPLVWRSDNNSVSPAQQIAKRKLFERRMRISLADGPEKAIEIFEVMSKLMGSNNDYYQQQALTDMLNIMDSIWRVDRKKWSDDLRAKNAALWGSYLGSDLVDGNIRSSGVRASAKAWIYDQLEGDGVAGAKWAEDISAAAQQRLTNYRFGNQVFGDLGDILELGEFSLDKRKAFALGICNYKALIRSMRTSGSNYTGMFARFVSSKLFSKEEMLTVGEEMAELAPRDGYAFAEMADYQAEAGNIEAAVKLFDAAIAAAGTVEDGDYPPFFLTRAGLVYKVSGAQSALDVLDGMDLEKIASNQRTDFMQLKMLYGVEALLDSSQEEEAVNVALSSVPTAPVAELVYADYSRLAFGFHLIAQDYLKKENFKRAAAFAKMAASAGTQAKRVSKGDSSGVVSQALTTMRRAAVGLGYLSPDVPLIEKGSEWFYLDDGTAPPDDWRTSAVAWKMGAAKLGYGDDDCVTIVSFGADKDDKHLVTYLQKQFSRPAGETFSTVTLYLLRDDGVVVYLDGKEIVRQNMPEGDITTETRASAAVSGSDEKRYFEVKLEPALVTDGMHTLAVQLHQAAPDSSDLGFDLALIANEPTPQDVFSSMSNDDVENILGEAVWSRLPEAVKSVDKVDDDSQGQAAAETPATTVETPQPEYYIEVQVSP
ncbi:MAG: hypothetical protein R3F19_04755 [Verrucomicrobiales bacterium]